MSNLQAKRCFDKIRHSVWKKNVGDVNLNKYFYQLDTRHILLLLTTIRPHTKYVIINLRKKIK